MCIIQTKCGAKGGSASLTANHSCCEGDSWVENIRWQLYSGTERSSLHDDGVCKQAYDRVCNETGGRRRRRMQAGVQPCVQRNGRSTTTAYASGCSSVCATYRAVNDDVVATGSNDGLSAHRGVKGLCMCDTCDLSALDSAQ